MTVRNAVKAGGAVIDVIANNTPFIKSFKGLPGLVGALSIGTAIGGALIAGIGEALNTGNAFQQEVRKATAVFGDLSQEQLKVFREAALEVSKVTLFTANELGTALFGIGSAGFSADQARAALLPVAQFAQASGSTIEAAAEQLSDSLEGFGLKSSDGDTLLNNTQRLSDLLVKANTTATTTAAQLSQGLGKAAGPLANAGVGIEETIAALTVFADTGLKGSEAGNALGNIVIDLENKAVKNAAAFKALGIEIFDAEGRFVGVAAAAANFAKATEGLSDEQKTARLATLGLNEETRKNIIRLKDGSLVQQRATEIMAASGLTAQTVANQITEQTAAVQRLSGALSELGDAVADSAIGDAQTRSVSALAIATEQLAKAVEESSILQSFEDLADFLNEPFDRGAKSFDRISTAITAMSTTLRVANAEFVDFQATFLETLSATVRPLNGVLSEELSRSANEFRNQATQLRGQIGLDIANAGNRSNTDDPATDFIKQENEQLQRQIDSITRSRDRLAGTAFAGSGFGAQEFINSASSQASNQERMLMALERLVELEEEKRQEEDELGPNKTIRAVVK